MGRNKHYGKILENIRIERAGAEGNCIAFWEGKVVFVKKAVPGDLVDLRINGKKRKFLLAEIDKIHESSENRVDPFCDHFGVCGGCKWQQMEYSEQLSFKAQQVKDALIRIGKLEIPEPESILGSERTRYYRNKLEFAFSNKRWILDSELAEGELDKNALGFHIPKRYDKVLQINNCHLQEEPQNEIRNWFYEESKARELTFYDIREQKGLMRNIMLRNNKKGDWMVLVCFGEESDEIQPLLDDLSKKFSQITSLFYAINTKVNDSIYDLNIIKHSGNETLIEELGGLEFNIRPKSFFQTNPYQAEALYAKALEYAGLTGSELVYDLYCGTGTISLYLARNAQKVVGIESVPQAIEDAHENAKMNGISNVDFEVGDMRFALNDDFTQRHGKPDVIVTDPPRAGMHKDVVAQMIKLNAEHIVYVSCNPATQARDLDLMRESYAIEKICPVDMFPHTHHVENVVLLKRIG